MKPPLARRPIAFAIAAVMLTGCATRQDASPVELAPAPQKKSGNWVFVKATSESAR